MTPTVSIIIPCYNEAGTIGGLLEAILGQTHPAEDLEVIIADGGSTDGTRQVIRSFAKEHPGLRLKLVENPQRTIPAALNTAIAQAQGDVIIRLDAHSAPRPDYVERCLETLNRTGAANAGGAWQIEPSGDGWISRSIAAAAAHPLGAGDARYRLRGVEGAVDTVPFGAYRRKWLERVGRFSEDLLSNEDYEFNVRIRRAGGQIWFNPAIRSVYYARPSLASVASQYARYGYWKARMLLRHPRSLRWRQALPAFFALSLMALGAASIFSPLAVGLLAVELGGYALVLVLAGRLEALRRRDPAINLGFPLALATMHLAWGGAFWWGLGSGIFHRGERGERREN